MNFYGLGISIRTEKSRKAFQKHKESNRKFVYKPSKTEVQYTTEELKSKRLLARKKYVQEQLENSKHEQKFIFWGTVLTFLTALLIFILTT